MLSGLLIAFQTLSILPLPFHRKGEFASSLAWFWLVGLTLGGLQLGVLVLAMDFWWEQIPLLALSLVILGVILTRGLHLDGLADWADALWGGATAERRLEIMKDTRLGTFGVLALVLILAWRWAGVVALLEADLWPWLVAPWVVSRSMQVELAVTYPYARAIGTAQAFVQGAGQRHRFFNHLPALAFLFAAYGLVGFLAFGLGLVAVHLLGFWAWRKLGGVTGDILGAGSELVESLILVVPLLGWIPFEPFW